MTDYRKLCIDLFGTDDPEKLKAIAQKAASNRNAGRSRKFTDDEIAHIKKLQSSGMSINDIAEKYGTSRQIVSKYINSPMRKGCTMRMSFMHRQTPCTIIDVDFLRKKIHIENKTDNIIYRAFGRNENPSWEDFQQFLYSRCFPKSRGNLDLFLEDLGIDNYDPLRIIEKTKGRCAEDNMHIRFDYRRLEKPNENYQA